MLEKIVMVLLSQYTDINRIYNSRLMVLPRVVAWVKSFLVLGGNKMTFNYFIIILTNLPFNLHTYNELGITPQS